MARTKVKKTIHIRSKTYDKLLEASRCNPKFTIEQRIIQLVSESVQDHGRLLWWTDAVGREVQKGWSYEMWSFDMVAVWPINIEHWLKKYAGVTGIADERLLGILIEASQYRLDQERVLYGASLAFDKAA